MQPHHNEPNPELVQHAWWAVDRAIRYLEGGETPDSAVASVISDLFKWPDQVELARTWPNLPAALRLIEDGRSRAEIERAVAAAGLHKPTEETNA